VQPALERKKRKRETRNGWSNGRKGEGILARTAAKPSQGFPRTSNCNRSVGNTAHKKGMKSSVGNIAHRVEGEI
jgi:hypothetical protein